MESGLEARPSSRARERARSLTLQTWEASCDASFPFMLLSTSFSAFLTLLSILPCKRRNTDRYAKYKYLPLILILFRGTFARTCFIDFKIWQTWCHYPLFYRHVKCSVKSLKCTESPSIFLSYRWYLLLMNEKQEKKL